MSPRTRAWGASGTRNQSRRDGTSALALSGRAFHSAFLLVPAALQHRQARIFRKLGFRGRTLTKIKSRSPRRLNSSHMHAAQAKADTHPVVFCFSLEHK